METVAGARARILDVLRPVGSEPVALSQALGRVLAAPLISARFVPGFDNSAMDGYALRAGDTAGAGPDAPVELRVVGESRAGLAPDAAVTPGTAVRIMTGAPIPDGADCVIRHEDTDDGRRLVQVRLEVGSGNDIRRAGEDMRPGDRILEPGRQLRSFDLAACAALGYFEIEVSRRPRVAVLSTGDELVEPDQTPGPGQVVNSNGVAICAAVTEAGGEPVPMGIAGDAADELRERLTAAAAACDLIVTTAGVSVGDHDHVRDVVSELGQLDFWRVAMRPGKPLAVGSVAGVPFLGLPGNPVSSQITFELFARPAIRTMLGAGRVERRALRARAAERMTKPAALEVYQRGALRSPLGDDPLGLPGVELTGPQGSGIMRSLVRADCLIALPTGITEVAVGDTVEVLMLG